MTSASPSMAVRLAVTLGATTLLTIGAVGVGAATSNSDKPESTREPVGPKGHNEPNEGTTTSAKGFPDEHPTSTIDFGTPNVKTPAECLYGLVPLARKSAVSFTVLSKDDRSELVAKVTGRDVEGQLDAILAEACGKQYSMKKDQVEFCLDVSFLEELGQAKVLGGDDPTYGFDVIIPKDPLKVRVPADSVQFCEPK